MLSFIHLSDIHFHKNSGDCYDLDEDLRNELLSDIRDNYPTSIPRADGILVCGDIAFSGKAEEYRIASEFLNHVCSTLSLSEEKVYCVPGNHDVDQVIPKKSPATKLLQQELESQPTLNEFDDYLANICRDPQSASALFAPIETYNIEFAEKYGCGIRHNQLYMSHSMPLNDNYRLCIFGINSALISNSDDHRNESERKMRVSQLQVPQRQNGDIYLTLCHHPPECWSDPEGLLKSKLNDRVHIQLYGHKHLQIINQIDNTLIISSGATHPSRRELDWIPRYNWITIEVTDESKLEISVYPRMLNKSESRFEKDCSLAADGRLRYTLQLPNATKHISEDALQPKIPLVEEISSPPMLPWEKRFVYSFMRLPYVRRNRIIERFGLESPEDDGLRHVEILESIMQRAHGNGCTKELLIAVEKENERMA